MAATRKATVLKVHSHKCLDTKLGVRRRLNAMGQLRVTYPLAGGPVVRLEVSLGAPHVDFTCGGFDLTAIARTRGRFEKSSMPLNQGP